MTLDISQIRNDFPILQEMRDGKRLLYLDNAATTQKPQVVMDTISDLYTKSYGNIHRGLYWLSEETTRQYEGTREKVRRFLNAQRVEEILFVRGATEGINLVAASYGRKYLQAGDEIVLSAMEHHSNIVPWQILCEEKGSRLRVIPMNDRGELLWEDFAWGEKTKLVAITHVSNALGSVNEIEKIIEKAHSLGAVVLIDGAQGAPHRKVDVQKLDCDFYAFSGHKLYAPTGSGVLYGKRAILEKMPPYQGGGDMIRSVTWEKTTYQDVPAKFEAGTPDIAAVVGLGAALDYGNGLGWDKIHAYEDELLEYSTRSLSKIEGLKIIGTSRRKVAVVSFLLEGVHPHDIGTILGHEGIAIRTGHHCAQPVMDYFHIPATARISLAFYNTKEEIDACVLALQKVREIFHL